MKKILVLVMLAGCGSGQDSKLNEQMDWLNDPSHIPGSDGPLEYTITSIPDSGSIAKLVWGGDWWPYSQGGTAKRYASNQLSPIEKYDRVVGNTSATAWEMQQVRELSGVSWAGHCNGLASAGTMSDEPKRDVIYRNVYFSVNDIKALLVESWQGGGVAIGGRCNNRNVTYDSNGRINEAECRDLNPASFHIILGNFIGKFRKPIIADSDTTEQVWNYPIVAYQITNKVDLNASDANKWLTGSQGSSYPYNPMAKRFRYIAVSVTYSNGYRPTYEYILELDDFGKIVGGEWFRGSQRSHPDFIWRNTVPQAEIPSLDVNFIYDIYRRSL